MSLAGAEGAEHQGGGNVGGFGEVQGRFRRCRGCIDPTRDPGDETIAPTGLIQGQGQMIIAGWRLTNPQTDIGKRLAGMSIAKVSTAILHRSGLTDIGRNVIPELSKRPAQPA